VDERGIIGALRLAGHRALEAVALAVEIDALLLDGRHDWLTPPPSTLFGSAALPGPRIPPVTTVVKGDASCVSIAAASVLAKVSRDAVMVEAHDRHPRYGWRDNKGYGTPDHLAALASLGPTPWHRTSWRLPEMRVQGTLGH
jgi:ribonuclease HII